MTSPDLLERISEREYRDLSKAGGFPSLSILLPLHPAGADSGQDPLVLKNLVSEARDRLVSTGMRGTEADRMLDQVHAWERDPGFLRNQNRGLVMLLGSEVGQYWHLLYEVGPLVTVSGRFQAKVLLPMLTDDQEFILLALSRNATRVFRGTRVGLREVTVPGLPADQKTSTLR